VGFLLVACASSPSKDAFLLGNMPGTGVFSPTHNAMREGDVIQVTFEGSTNLNTSQKISFDGVINMPFIGKVKAAGKTTIELEALLTVLYENQIKPTEISVQIMSQAAVVYVAGAVLKPGKIPLERPMTFLDAIMEAGGVDHGKGKLTEVTLLRIEGDKRRAFRLNLKRALAGEDVELIYLKPFDIIYVPERTFNF
jgi:polysaccharide export outer membrane protein